MAVAFWQAEMGARRWRGVSRVNGEGRKSQEAVQRWAPGGELKADVGNRLVVRAQWQVKDLSGLWELLKVLEQRNDRNWIHSSGRVTWQWVMWRVDWWEDQLDDDGRPGEAGWNSPLRKGSEKKRRTARVTVEIKAEGYGRRVAAGGCNRIMGLQNYFKR